MTETKFEKPLRILHVEDRKEDAELISAALKSEGVFCEMVRVENRTDFISCLDKGGYDIILSDYSLPSFDGREALNIARDKNPDIPFIYVSGTMGEEVAIESLKIGANDYVLKHGLERLAPAVLRALRESGEKKKRKEAEMHLINSERRLAEAQQLAHVGGFEVDIRTNTVTWTDELYRIFGVHPQSFTPSYESYLERLHPDDRPATEAAIQKAFSDHQPFNYDQRIVRPDGSIRIVHAQTRVILDEAGKPVKMAGSCQDITERKMLENQLLQAGKMEAIGRLAGGVAHDFNNLLTVILGLCDFLRQEVPAAQRDDVGEIQKAGERAAALTRQLLAFSRRQVMQPEILDLNAIVTDIAQMLRRLLGEDVRLAIKLDPSVKRIKVDPGQIEQVIVNLSVNARDAMPRGGVLTIATSTESLDKEIFRQNEPPIPAGSYTLLTVTDTGHGMTEQVKANIFEPFFTTKGQGKGTGLGLSTVYGIVQQSGAFIAVSSAVEKGTVFKIYFPQASSKAPDTPSPRAKDPVSVSPGAITILLVEDEEKVRRLISAVLEKKGFHLLIAKNGAEALKLAGEFEKRIDLLLTDIVMPDMNGLDLAGQLAPLRPQMRVLYTSGYTDHEIFRSNDLASSPAFLPKPFMPATLLQKIGEVLSVAKTDIRKVDRG